MAHRNQGPHAEHGTQAGAPVQSAPPLPRLPGRGRLVTGQPEPALFAWVMDANEGVDDPVPYWPARARS